MTTVWSLRPVDRRRRTRRGFVAAAASVLLPGAGHLVVGRRRKGAVLVALSLAIGGAAVWLVTQDVREIATWLLQPTVLVWLTVGNVAVLLLRVYATFDAYAEGIRPPAQPVLPRSRWRAAGVTVGLVLVAAVVAAPHALAGVYAASAHSMVTSLFIDDVADAGPGGQLDPPIDQPTPGAPAPDPDPGTVTGSEDPEDPEEPEEGEEPEDAEEPAEAENPWLAAGRINVALLGSDAGPGRSGDRIDTLMVASFDPATGDAAVFSVDRYLADFPLPERIEQTYREHCPFGDGWRYLNALYRCAHERVPEEFAALYPRSEDPAAAAVAEALGELLGIAVPYYAMVDMAGFVEVVDALGGVEMDLPEPFLVRMSPVVAGDDWYVVDLPAGQQTLDGREAIAYVRTREATGGDADRMRRQRCLIRSMADSADIGSLLVGFPSIAGAIEEHVITSIPMRLLPDLIGVTALVDQERLVTVGFGPPDYRGADHRPDVDAIRARVAQVLADPASAVLDGRTSEMGADVCG